MSAGHGCVVTGGGKSRRHISFCGFKSLGTCFGPGIKTIYWDVHVSSPFWVLVNGRCYPGRLGWAGATSGLVTWGVKPPPIADCPTVGASGPPHGVRGADSRRGHGRAGIRAGPGTLGGSRAGVCRDTQAVPAGPHPPVSFHFTPLLCPSSGAHRKPEPAQLLPSPTPAPSGPDPARPFECGGVTLGPRLTPALHFRGSVTLCKAPR